MSKSEVRETLAKAIDTGGPIYVDAIDEIALYEPTIFRILQHVLTTSAAQGVAWRLACRPAAWNPALADSLRSQGFSEWRLLPLDRPAAHKLVATVVADAQQFLDALVEANLGRLSASPMQLAATARQWQATGRLPASQADSIRFEIQRLLSETNAALPPPALATDRQYRLAGRLGAIAVLSGVTGFARAATQAPGTLAIADIPSNPEADEPGTPIEPNHFDEVLRTALFDAAPHGTVAFRHQQYAEYLAADYISRRPVAHAQLPALLGTRNGLLPGPVMGVAAWLTALIPSLTQDLISVNALALTQAGVELPEAACVKVIDGLLAAAKAGDIDPEWGLDLSGLVHPGLEQHLAGHVETGIEQPAQVWWVSRLAESGRCTGLVKILRSLALDPGWQAWARRAAISAVSVLGGDDDRRELQALLCLDGVTDPDDELLAGAIDALYPELMSTTTLLDVLRPRRNGNLVGGYLVLLGTLADRIPPEDLPTVLAWAVQRVRDENYEKDYGRLIGQLIMRGWASADTATVREPLTDLIAQLLRPPTWGLRRNGLPWAEGSHVERRQKLAVAVAERLDEQRWYQLLRFGLITSTDIEWLIEELPGLPILAQSPLANCVSPLLDHPTASQADMILSLTSSHPAYEPTRWWRDPVPVQSETADRLREFHSYEKQDEAEFADTLARRSEQLSMALANAVTDISTWWRIAYWLANGDEASESLFTHDLKMRPGWALLSDDEQQLVVELGLRYLDAHAPQPTNWAGRQTITTDKALPDWSGVYLLTTLARHAPSRVRQLKKPIWQRWAPAIVGAWNYEGGEDAQLRCDLVDLAPSEVRAHIVDASLDHLDALAANDQHLTPFPLFDHLCAELAPVVAERIAENRYGDQLGGSLLDLLVKHSPHVALPVCRRLCQDNTSPLSTTACRKLAELDPAGTVDDLVSYKTLADELSTVAPRVKIGELDDGRLAALCRLLLDRFPVANDPPDEPAMFGSDVYETRQVRNRTVSLLAERGQVRTLEELANERPEAEQLMIRYYLRTARAKAADLAYTHPTPHSLLTLLGQADARLVRSSSDLTYVLIEQLQEIQHHLTHGGGFRDIWNIIDGHEPRPNSEDDISDWVRRQLEARLGNGSVIDREIQVERTKSKGFGTRMDLTATKGTPTYPASTARVIAEAKLVNNQELESALHEQLVQKYLKPAGLQHGIYLVYWVNADQRPASWARKGPTDRSELLNRLKQQADSVRPDFEIQAFILDISRP
ncbi:hypothetical protein HC028_09235 [Planosporangium flavigriseum]|uniref:hypothetical protein n=1 Tax=Planosporangium flavigriseum TaxID=373681 RepID=UPI00143B6996|nr:hypothetical protein [Planosporangium flavigriseum]NJC64684.1 hypothetical protein [Planosporangium flavigriseum]